MSWFAAIRGCPPRQAVAKAKRKAKCDWGFAAALAVAAALPLAAAGNAQARDTSAAVDALPQEAQQTVQRVLHGGPFDHAKDGSIFANREGLLPRRTRGYYREYTVPTPGARDRGGRRVVCGGERPQIPDSCYYTADHYASFRPIAR